MTFEEYTAEIKTLLLLQKFNNDAIDKELNDNQHFILFILACWHLEYSPSHTAHELTTSS